MHWSQCGVQAAEGERVCPNGHALPARPAEVISRAGKVTRRVASVLGASVPLPVEVRVVVVGLKTLSALFALFTFVGWWRTASILAQLGLGAGGPLAGLAAGLTANLAVYGFALLVQMAAARAGREG
jgi:hypothetical protein